MRTVVELALFTNRVAELTTFYERLTETAPTYASPQIAIFDLGGLKLLIHANSAPLKGMPPNTDHFAFRAIDLAAAHQALVAQGLTFRVEPRTFDWGKS